MNTSTQTKTVSTLAVGDKINWKGEVKTVTSLHRLYGGRWYALGLDYGKWDFEVAPTKIVEVI